MMRSRKHMVLCVRKPDKDIVTNVEQLNPLADKYKILGVPFIRGVVNMLESMYLGMKGIMFSGEIAIDDPAEAKSDQKSMKFQYSTTSRCSCRRYWSNCVFSVSSLLFSFLAWFNGHSLQCGRSQYSIRLVSCLFRPHCFMERVQSDLEVPWS